MTFNISMPRRTALALVGLAGASTLVPACTSAVDQKAGGPGKSGGVLKILQGADIAPSSFFSQNNPNMSIRRAVFNTLTEYDHASLEPKPQLATSWKIRGHGRTVDLKLRDDVTFHTGRPFTASDVEFAIDYMKKDTTVSQLKHVANAITKVTSHGDHAVTLRLAHPVSNLFDLFEIMIIPDRESIDELVKGTKIVGTGPFKVQSIQPGVGVTLKKNKAYWKAGQPYLDGVDISVVRQSQSMLSSLRSGQSHLVLDLAPLDAASIKDDPGYAVVVSDAFDSAFYVASNVNIPPLNDKSVRQAIAYAIDRDRILQQVLGGIGRTTSLPWSALSSPAFDPAKTDHYTYRPDQAKQMIRQAGAKGETIQIVYNAGLGTNAAIAEIVQFNLQAIGLKAKAVPLQAPDFQAKLTSGQLPGLFVNGHGFGHLKPATLVKGAFPFNAEKNASNFDSPAYRAVADKLWTKTDPASQRAAIERVNDLLLEEQFVSDLVSSAHTFTISKRVKGLKYSMFDDLVLDAVKLG